MLWFYLSSSIELAPGHFKQLFVLKLLNSCIFYFSLFLICQLWFLDQLMLLNVLSNSTLWCSDSLCLSDMEEELNWPSALSFLWCTLKLPSLGCSFFKPVESPTYFPFHTLQKCLHLHLICVVFLPEYLPVRLRFTGLITEYGRGATQVIFVNLKISFYLLFKPII